MSEAPPPTPNRKQIFCDHCGKSMKKKKLQEHTTRVHGTKVIPRERQLSGQTKLNIFQIKWNHCEKYFEELKSLEHISFEIKYVDNNVYLFE